MKSVLKEITDVFTTAMRTAIPVAADATAQMTMCQKLALGHYQCNRCALRESVLCARSAALRCAPPGRVASSLALSSHLTGTRHIAAF